MRKKNIGFLRCWLVLSVLLVLPRQLNSEEQKGEKFFERARNATVFIVVRLMGTSYTPQGTGFLIDSSGKILTVAHLVSGQMVGEQGLYYAPVQTISVYFNSGTKRVVVKPARILNPRLDPNVDVALLQVEGNFQDYLPLPVSENLSKAEEVWALGYPMGLELEESSLGPEIRIFHGNTTSLRTNPRGELVQIEHDAALFPGASGGPLLNSTGELLGINAWATAEDRRLAFSASFIRSLMTGSSPADITSVQSTPSTEQGIPVMEIPGLQWYLPVDRWEWVAMDVDGTLFVIYQNSLHRINADGLPVWSIAIEGTPCCPPAISSRQIAVFASPLVQIFDKETGIRQKSFSTEKHLFQRISFTPDSFLLLYGPYSGAYVYDLNGTLKWYIQNPSLAGPPLALGGENYLVIPRGGGKIYKFRQTEKLGEITFPTHLGGMPVDSGEGWYLVRGYPGPVYGFTLEGRILWSTEAKAYAGVEAIALSGERMLFVDSSGKNLILAQQGKEVWKFRLVSQGLHWGKPAVGKGGNIVVSSQPPLGWHRFYQQVWVLDENGTVLWQMDTPEVHQSCLGDLQFFPDGSILLPFRTRTVLPDGKTITLAVGKVNWKEITQTE